MHGWRVPLVLVLITRAGVSGLAAPPACHMNIQGTGGRSVSQASLECTGGTITAAAHTALLGPYLGGFRGVVWDDKGCGATDCLLTLCGNTTASFLNSVVANVNSLETLQGIICIVGNSNVSFEGSLFAYNSAINGTLHVRNNAKVSLVRSVVTGNAATGVTLIANGTVQYRERKGTGAGIYLTGTAQLEMSSCTVSNNTASHSGGGLWAEDSAAISVSNTTFDNNKAIPGVLDALVFKALLLEQRLCVYHLASANGSLPNANNTLASANDTWAKMIHNVGVTQFQAAVLRMHYGVNMTMQILPTTWSQVTATLTPPAMVMLGRAFGTSKRQLSIISTL